MRARHSAAILRRMGIADTIATDIDDYARQANTVLGAVDRLAGGVVPRPQWRPSTRFEQRGMREGRTATDLVYGAVRTELFKQDPPCGCKKK